MIPKTLLLAIAFTLAIAQSCLEPRVRKAWEELSENDKDLLVNGIWELKRTGVYKTFVDVYSANTKILSSSSFLPWHRWFLWKFEESLRNLGEEYKCLTVPYWDWEKDKGDEEFSSVFGHHFGSKTSTNCVSDGSFSFARGWSTTSGCLKRVNDKNYGFVGQSQILAIILKNQNYGVFRKALSSAPYTSVRHFLGELNVEDPLFFLHISNIDRLWAIWEDCRDYEKIDTTNLNNDRKPFYEATQSDDLLLSTLPFFSSSGEIVSIFNNKSGSFPSAKDLLLIKQNSNSEMDYSYDEKDELVDLIDKRFNDFCHWDWFASSKENEKRSLESVEHRNGDRSSSQSSPKTSSTSPRNFFGKGILSRSNSKNQKTNPIDFNYYYEPTPNGYLSGYTYRYQYNPYQSNSNGHSHHYNPYQFNTYQFNPYESNSNQYNPYQFHTYQFNPYQFNPYQFNSYQFNPYFNPFQFNPYLFNPNQFYTGFGNNFNSRGSFQRNNRNHGSWTDKSDTQNSKSPNLFPPITFNPKLTPTKTEIPETDKSTHIRQNPRGRNSGRNGGFSNDKVEDAWEKIDAMFPKISPITKINIVAIIECLETGRKKHASEEWIKQEHMENMREIFEPICPDPKCCKISEIYSTAMVCSSGLVSNMSCSADCDWRYDCQPQGNASNVYKNDYQIRMRSFVDSSIASGAFSEIPAFFWVVVASMLLFF